MSLVKRDQGLSRFFDDFVNRDIFDWALSNYSSTGTTLPAVNIRETQDHFEVEMAAPGMRKKDFKIELNGNLLTISSEKQDTHENKENGRYTLREYSYQSFQRSFRLPQNVVDEDKIKAQYENGMLLLLIPKKEEAKPKPARTIAIN